MSAVGLASVFAVSGTKASGQILGANDRVCVGVVGIRGRGFEHIDAFGTTPNVEVAALVDNDMTKSTVEMLPELKNPQFVLGQQLQFDETRENFPGNDAANALLTRKYRTPYVVPENV